jgi:nitrite reductase/ring-hydroxylating ferredoxin subunit
MTVQSPLQQVAERFETMEELDPIAEKLTTWFDGVVKPGPLKDLLAGTWFGHALHPPLTAATIGAWISATFLDSFGGERSRKAADRLIMFGLMSAVPTIAAGWNELADTDGKPKRLATAHALGNAAVVTLFDLSWLSRKAGWRGLGRLLALAGMGLVAGTAGIGGHLSFIRGVGVNQTAFEKPRNRWTAVLADEELPEAKLTRASLDGIELVLYRTEGMIYALSNRCSHRGGPLFRGQVDDGGECLTVQCPWHKSVFCMEDGEIEQGPATAPQPAYEARINEGKVEVRPRAASR